MKLRIMLLAGLLAAFTANAQPILPPLFSDNMVLQHDSEQLFWGEADPGAKIKIAPSWTPKAYKVVADEDGCWSVKIKTPAPGGPFTIKISEGKQKMKLREVYSGEVWLCSGQSNMEMKVADKVLGWEKEIEKADRQKQIHLLRVEHNISPVPADDLPVAGDGWTMPSKETLPDFSATAWFFGKELVKELGKTHIGLIESCWGGTIIETWTSAGTLGTMDRYKPALKQLERIPAGAEARREYFEGSLRQWEREIAAADPYFAEAIYPGNTEKGWIPANVPGYLQNQGIPGMHGFFWMKKEVTLPEDWTGRDLELSLGFIDDNDCTYFNGEWIGHVESCVARRNYAVPGRLVKAGTNVIAVRVMDTGGLSGMLGSADNIYLRRAGAQVVPLTGEWLCKEIMGTGEAPVFPADLNSSPNTPTTLYNGMIHPLINYNIAGAIWYQGESNASAAAEYKVLMPALIADWRGLWGYDFPFYYCQIANYLDPQTGPERSEWAALREAQMETLAVKGTGMAVLIDIGEARDIHPKNKPEVGRRLALNALAKTYGKDVVPCGPIFDNYIIEGKQIRVSFSNIAGGLIVSDGSPARKKSLNVPLSGFYIAGPDQVFYEAKAVIDGLTVVVSAEEVEKPLSVRYGWANNPSCNLYNTAGLPASPFRTDRWPL